MSSASPWTTDYCRICSSGYNYIWHTGRCPNVKSIEYYKDGAIKKIEYVDPVQPTEPFIKLRVIDGELCRVEDSSPPGLTPLSPDAGILTVRNWSDDLIPWNNYV